MFWRLPNNKNDAAERYMRNVFARRVQRGMKLLDTSVVAWEHKVNIVTLDLGNTRCCVIGQLFGDYYHGLMQLTGISDTQAYSHGFSVAIQDEKLYDSFTTKNKLYTGSSYTLLYALLTDEWRKAIQKKRMNLPPIAVVEPERVLEYA